MSLKTTVSLRAIQQAYADAIYAGQDAALGALIRESTDFSKTERIAVYRNNTLGTLKSTLCQTYPVCRALVGNRYFDQLATYHVAQNPSQRRNLDDYGDNFAETLDSLMSIRQELTEHDYLVDVARMEWQVHRNYFVPDRTPFGFAAFAALDPEQQGRVVFNLNADVSLMKSRYPLHRIVASHAESTEKNEDAKDELDTALNSNADSYFYFVIHRAHWKAEVTTVEPAVFRLLKKIERGARLDQLTAELEKSPWDIASLIERGLIGGFSQTAVGSGN